MSPGHQSSGNQGRVSTSRANIQYRSNLCTVHAGRIKAQSQKTTPMSLAMISLMIDSGVIQELICYKFSFSFTIERDPILLANANSWGKPRLAHKTPMADQLHQTLHDVRQISPSRRGKPSSELGTSTRAKPMRSNQKPWPKFSKLLASFECSAHPGMHSLTATTGSQSHAELRKETQTEIVIIDNSFMSTFALIGLSPRLTTNSCNGRRHRR